MVTENEMKTFKFEGSTLKNIFQYLSYNSSFNKIDNISAGSNREI